MDPYAPIAAAWDTMTADYDYGRWLAVIQDHAREFGVRGNRVLDVACGSGSSFLPLLGRYDITACDLSAAMLEQARARAGEHVQLFQHDMRTLPAVGEFDLVLCLDDALNHLLDPAEVRDALAGIARNLAHDGVAVFDFNTLRTLRTVYSSDASIITEDERRHLVLWRGQGPSDLEPGGLTSVRIDALTPGRDGYTRRTATITERHHPVSEVMGLVEAVGLRVVRCLGQSTGVRMSPEADELEHNRALFIACRA